MQPNEERGCCSCCVCAGELPCFVWVGEGERVWGGYGGGRGGGGGLNLEIGAGYSGKVDAGKGRVT